jgi:hypothetical protein
MYEDLAPLQDIVARHIPVIGSLSYLEWRRCRGVIDGDLLDIFLNMERLKQSFIVDEYIKSKEADQLDKQLMDILDERVRSVRETGEWLCSLIERLESIVKS